MLTKLHFKIRVNSLKFKCRLQRFLRLENGIPTIYKRFLANCKYSGFENVILPINTTTSVGIKLLQR
jgi:hypothetical protein